MSESHEKKEGSCCQTSSSNNCCSGKKFFVGILVGVILTAIGFTLFCPLSSKCGKPKMCPMTQSMPQVPAQ